jgi:selenide,water dikinase
MARAGLVPGGSQRNRTAADAYTDVAPGVDPVRALLACDAQTSGGLLAALPPEQWGTVGWVIGEIVDGPAGRITLV